MSEIYVDVGPMGFLKDPKKVATKYTKNAKKLMRETAIKAIRGAAGFTPDKKGEPRGFYFDATLAEISFGTHGGQPSVTCKANAVIATYPAKSFISAKMNSSATVVGGTEDRDVEDGIMAMMEDATQRALAVLRKQPKP